MHRYGGISAALSCIHPSTQPKSAILVALATVGVATLIRLALDPVLGSHGPYLFFAIAVIMAALYAGAWAGVVAVVVSIPICDYLFIDPLHTWFSHDARADSIMLALFAALGLLTTFIIDRLHENRTRLKKSLTDLQRSEAQLDMIDATVPAGLFTAAEDGTAEHLNGFFSKYSGQESDSLTGIGWLDLIHPGDLNALLTGLSGEQQESEQFERIIRLRRADGQYRSFKCRARRKLDSKVKKWFGVCSDIDDERALAAALESRTRELVRLNQSLERFAYTASHDLKEPLRTIGATVELFLRHKRSDLDAESSQMLASVTKAVGRMSCLIRDIMELARATNAAAEKEAVNVPAVIEFVIANLAQAIAESDARIVVEQLPIVYANKGAMLRLFQNLIENSIKYRNHKPPEVYISAAPCNAEYIFSIKDNGIGIDPQFRDEIFEPFRRLYGRSQYEGSGLGLAACRRIVKSLNGRIWVESKLGKGSTFFFAIPKQ